MKKASCIDMASGKCNKPFIGLDGRTHYCLRNAKHLKKTECYYAWRDRLGEMHYVFPVKTIELALLMNGKGRFQ